MKVKKCVLFVSFIVKDNIEDYVIMRIFVLKFKGFWDLIVSVIKEQWKQLKNNCQMKKGDDVLDMFDDYKFKVVMVIVINLSSEQEYVLDFVVNQGKSVFFMGLVGMGKFVLMRVIIVKLKEKYVCDFEWICVMVLMGLVVCNIGGIIFYSFLGMLIDFKFCFFLCMEVNFWQELVLVRKKFWNWLRRLDGILKLRVVG